MTIDQSTLIFYKNPQTNKLFKILRNLGYLDSEIKTAITYYNLHSCYAIQEVQLPLAVGMLVKIIEQNIK